MTAAPIHVGLSGFSHPQWGGAGTPTPERLRSYAAVFQTVEIAQTFYRDPLASAVRRWRERVPGGFTFTVVASRLLTHILRLQRAEAALERMWQAYTPFGSQLACVTFQLPSTLRADATLLDRFSAAALAGARKEGLATRLAFEFRHRSWYGEETMSLLCARGIAAVTHDMPSRGDIVPVFDEAGGLALTGNGGVTPDTWLKHGSASFFHFRMYGTAARHPGAEYGQDGLAPWIAAAQAARGTGSAVFLTVVGDESNGAVRDGLAARRTMEGKGARDCMGAQAVPGGRRPQP